MRYEKENKGRNYLAFREELSKRGEVARGLRSLLALGCLVLLVLVLWFGLRAAAAALPAWVEAQEREQQMMQDEYDALEAAYGDEMIEGALREARLRDNGQAVDASAWQHSSEASECWKGDGE